MLNRCLKVYHRPYIGALWNRIGVAQYKVILHRNFYRTSVLLFQEKKATSLEKSFSILKLSAEPNFKELREKYINQAKIYHPDSGNPAADSVKFTQLQEAYKVVHSYLRNADENQEDEEEETDDDISDDSHIAPQHRQFLNYGGFGFGSPSQREKTYKKQQVLKAFQRVSNHKVQKQAEQPTDGKSLTVKQKKSVKRNQVTNAIERLVEDLIQESMAKGDFDNLSGKGRPLPSKTQYCPFIDISQHNLNQVLVNNGVVPEFVALERDIKFLLTDLKSKLYKERLKLGPEPLNDFNKKKWTWLVLEFSEEVKGINKKITHFNLVAPLLRLQKVHVRPEREVEKVLGRYEEYEKELIESQEQQRNEESKDNNKTFIWSVMSQITDKVFKRVLRQTMSKD